eukprot:TRINITY_DN2491_c0_g1_i1.p1 TRINITY_DN2491_c0_g1~~TRINITY_DN2491_c0_g1_i1.p1  ORF type:complete len:437 (-),score=174.61 TRINITY_DN2491_c0_g1_i1:102-1412(-)
MSSDRKIKKKKKGAARHDPLEKQIREAKGEGEIEQKNRNKGEQRAERRGKTEEFMSDTLSKKILKQARAQLEDDEDEDFDDSSVPQQESGKKQFAGLMKKKLDDSDDDNEVFSETEDNYLEEFEDIEEGDERILQMFMSNEAPERKSIADIIMEKIKEKEEGGGQQTAEQQQASFIAKLDPKVIDVYRNVGQLMKKYTSGKVPKAFKILPSLSKWEEILYLTNPDEWSPPAYFQATKIFASNFNNKMAQRFFNLILLPKVLTDIKEHKKLNFHLYLSLKKSLFKPAAFFKGILLPLVESQNCTLREALVVGSVLARVSIPVLHSAVALLKICEMPYSGANSLFIRILLDKKYNLPLKVVHILVNHFFSFLKETRQLPVLWFQSLLTFVQRYKGDITPEQREKLRLLLQAQAHPKITSEIRRELFFASADEVEMAEK